MVSFLYILGTTRSGTSALRNAIWQSRYKGYGEGHLVPLLAQVMALVRQEKAQGQGARVPGNALHDLREHVMIRHLVHGYETYHMTVLGGVTHVLDKTPNVAPILLAPDLLTFHQRARFLHCSRRHVDNLQSKRRKFPDQPFRDLCLEWAGCMKAWLDVQPKLGSACLGIDFYDLATDPAGTATRIGALLDLTEEETARIAAYLGSERPEGTPGSDLTRALALSGLDWPDGDKQTLIDICKPVGDLFGYGLETYYA